MRRAPPPSQRGATLLLLGWLCAGAARALPDEPKRVLLLHSFGHHFSPYNEISEGFRTELARQLGTPVEFLDVALESARSDQTQGEEPFLHYLRSLVQSGHIDLLAPVGGPAVRFAQRTRSRLGPAVPMLLLGADQRHTAPSALTTNDVAAAAALDIPGTIEEALRLLPATTNVAIVLGDSPLERFWVSELRRDLEPLSRRVHFTWLNELSFDLIQQRAARLPPRSILLFGQMSVDRSGIPHEAESGISALHRCANAPMFGLFDFQLGLGIVGGRLIPVHELSREAAAAAARILRGEPPARLRVEPTGPGPPVYDWRELRRWGIDPGRLAPGSTVLHSQPSVWTQYWGRIIAVAAVCIGQTLLVLALMKNLLRRREAEQSLHDLTGRLITAQESERARLARELHDDFTQRLARLAIDAGRAQQCSRDADQSGLLTSVREGLVQISDDVHTLSYRLHPSLLEDLGLVHALRAECDRVSRSGACRVVLKQDALPAEIPAEVALGVFRIAQESLQNVVRHARATTASVSLRAVDDGLLLAVSDDGTGFDPRLQRHRPSLGLASMGERVRLLRGELDIDSAPGRGTAIVAWIPLRPGPSTP